jgi:hypothetical protein
VSDKLIEKTIMVKILSISYTACNPCAVCCLRIGIHGECLARHLCQQENGLVKRVWRFIPEQEAGK